MIPDDERRAIAAALHECGRCSGRKGLRGMSFQRRLAQLCGVEGATWRMTMHVVAELIEPRGDLCCYIPVDYEGSRLRCSNCGLVLKLAHGTLEENEMRYCPKCGRRIVHACKR